MIIDVHAHYYPEEYLVYLGRTELPPKNAAHLASQSLEQRLDLLDQTGIGMEVLSVSQAQPYLPDGDQAMHAAQLVNTLYVELSQKYPDRFRTFVALPLPHVDLALQELERVYSEPLVVGVTLGCSVGGKPIDDRAFEPVFGELDGREATVFLHPMGRDDIPWLQDYNLAWMVGAPFEDTVTALRLVISGVTSRYPHIRFIVPHLGGTLPFLAARIFRQNEAAERLGAGLKRMYFDTVSGQASSLLSAAEAFGADHLLFGTDYPYCDEEQFRHHLSYLADVGFSSEVLDNIKGRTARKLLDI